MAAAHGLPLLMSIAAVVTGLSALASQPHVPNRAQTNASIPSAKEMETLIEH